MLRSILALSLALALPASVLADDHHNGGSSSGSSHGSYQSSQSHSAPPQRGYSGAPQRGYSGGGYSGAPQQRSYAAPQYRYSAPREQQHNYSTPQYGYSTPQQRGYTPQQYGSQRNPQSGSGYSQQHGYTRSGGGYSTQSGSFGGRSSYASGPYNAHYFSGSVVGNPHHWGGGWGWNHGIAWFPASIYWGGGFWGPWAFDGLAAAVLFGSVVDYNDQAIYPSYEVAPQSPGAELLQNYGLQQTECGPPDLVTIWGPNNSVICAYPNNLVAPGTYELDPETLTITSSNS